MKYLLVLGNGKKLTFYVKACAEMFQSTYGGTLSETKEILNQSRKPFTIGIL